MTPRTSFREQAVPPVRRSDADIVGTDFAALFDRHAPAIHRYLARRVGPTADDLLAQTFLIAYERRSTSTTSPTSR